MDWKRATIIKHLFKKCYQFESLIRAAMDIEIRKRRLAFLREMKMNFEKVRAKIIKIRDEKNIQDNKKQKREKRD